MNDAANTDRWIRWLNTVQLVLAGVLIMAPTVWMVLSSFKPSFEVTAYPPTLIFSPTLDNYVELTRTTPFLSYALNSLIVTVGSTALGLLFGVPAAFAAFPGELFGAIRPWAERSLNLKQWSTPPRGGHFAAMEEPELYVEDVRSFFRTLR